MSFGWLNIEFCMNRSRKAFSLSTAFQLNSIHDIYVNYNALASQRFLFPVVVARCCCCSRSNFRCVVFDVIPFHKLRDRETLSRKITMKLSSQVISYNESHTTVSRPETILTLRRHQSVLVYTQAVCSCVWASGSDILNLSTNFLTLRSTKFDNWECVLS